MGPKGEEEEGVEAFFIPCTLRVFFLAFFFHPKLSCLTRVGQRAKVLKCPNFRAFSHSFCLNIYKNGQKHETF